VRRLALDEHTTRTFAAVPPEIADAIAASKAARVWTNGAGQTVLRTSSYVGVIRIGDEVELRVRPKITIHRLLWLLGYARDPKGWRDDTVVGLSEVDDLMAAVAISYLATARRALAGGVLQGYRVTDEASPVLRGRLREADQLRNRLGLAVPVEIRYDDYTTDIPENQLLLAAALRLLHLPGVPAATRLGLRHLITLLADVRTLPPTGTPPATADTRLTRRYQPALRLARIVLAGHGLDQPPGDVAASGFLFDLDHAFEDWLMATLGRALAPFGGDLDDQHRTHLDDDLHIGIRPDLVWQIDGQYAGVLDAKYKRIKHTTYPHGDVYQLLAYCAALDLSAGHLVYAAGGTENTQHVVRHAGTRLHVWSLDLSQPIPQLLAQIDRLARAVAGNRPRQP
jgi:5-methylcytosine-specific restriction enzyme subunit McrC